MVTNRTELFQCTLALAVTVLNQCRYLGWFEPEIAQAAKAADMEADGVTFMLKSSLTKVEETEAGLNLTVENRRWC